MRSLILCNSVYQVFTALNLKLNMLDSETVDIMITDIIPEHAKLAKRLENSGLFEMVYAVNSKFISRQQYKMTRSTVYGYRTFPKVILKQAGAVPVYKYHDFYFSNYDHFSSFLYLQLHRMNKSLNVSVFEDGGSSYIMTYQDVNKVEKRLERFLGMRPLGSTDARLLLYEPDLYCRNDYDEVDALPKISLADQKFRDKVNYVFHIDDIVPIDEDYIFMEESFVADGLENNDAEIIEECYKICGKDNFILKPHPRNPYNRFENSGVKILNTNVPWEVYCHNQNLKDKIVLTVSSNTAISPHILYQEAPKSILLYKLLKGRTIMTEKPEFNNYMLKASNMFSKKLFIPDNFENLRFILMQNQ